MTVVIAMDEGDTTVTNKTLAEKHLRKFGSFLEHSAVELLNVLHSADSTSADDNRPSLPFASCYPTIQHIHHLPGAPIHLTFTPIIPTSSSQFEEIIAIPLPPEGNPDVQKVLLVLTSLTQQLAEYRHSLRNEFVLPIALYGEGIDAVENHSSSSEGDGLLALSKFLPVLYKLQNFLKIGRQLCIHWIAQMGSLFKDSKPHVVNITPLNLATVFKEFGDFLAILVILDKVIESQVTLQDHWGKYRMMISSVQADSSTFATNGDQLVSLEKELFLLDKEVLSANTFLAVIQDLNVHSGRMFAKSVTLVDKFHQYLTTVCGNNGSMLEKDFVDGNDELKPISALALLVFSATLCILVPTSIDWKKFFQKSMLESYKKIIAVPIFNTAVLFLPDEFLMAFKTLKIVDNKILSGFKTNRQNYLQTKVNGLQKEVMNSSVQISRWSVKLQEIFYSKSLHQLQFADLSRRCNLMLQGVKYAQGLCQLFLITINLHATLNKPISTGVLTLLFQVLELLKEIQSNYSRFSVQISTSAIYIMQHVMHTALNHVKSVQKSLVVQKDLKKLDEIRGDALSVLKILENALRGPPSTKRLLVAKITLDWALGGSKFWRNDDEAVIILPAAIERITAIVEMEQKIQQLTSGSPLYFHRLLLSSYFTRVYKNELDAQKLPLMFMILEDCYRFLDHNPHHEEAKRNFIKSVESCVKLQLENKLYQDVETDLRLLAHTHLQQETSKETLAPFRIGVKEAQYFFECPTLQFHSEKSINFRLFTEHYLSKTFYNLATVALHDWQSYATMRVLAEEKYRLEVVDDHLPGHSLEQGRDILEIMRNLPKFVKEFTYNLNNQVFVQVSSQNKHLDTVNIRHLANSMRTHGPGMANTTVNATYQYLRSMMKTFSQFLFEEQIRSRLSKDIRVFKQTLQGQNAATTTAHSNSGTATSSTHHHQLNFPFKAAEKFKKGNKKLGLKDGLTWLDHFRIHITQIGNALGFVRLVRSGGVHYLAGGCRFVPDLEDISGLSHSVSDELDTKTYFSQELEKATQSVDMSLKTLTSTFSGGVDYFKLLVDAFSSAFRNDTNSHLKNFYVVIPALTISYVDYMRSCKEMLSKKSKSATTFTEDGFPMGLAYLLQVLGQDTDFDSLGWFQSVKQHFDSEKRRENQIVNESRNDEKLEQASKLTAKRFQDQQHEFQLLQYNLSSARIFFQHNQQSIVTT